MPFIGVTDFMRPEHVRAMRRVLDRLDSKLMLGVGVMMSRKTLKGLPTKWRGVFPEVYNVRRIFLAHPGLFNVLHYADFDGLSGAEELFAAADWAGENVDALQLDMIWPSMMLLSEFKEEYRRWRKRSIQIIMQINSHALQECNNNPLYLVAVLKDYHQRGLVDYVLLDRSHGKGVAMDGEDMLLYVRELQLHLPELGIVIAGGLGPRSVHLAEPIIKHFPNVSIDAQSKLRPSGNALDPLDFSLVTQYLMQADQMYKMCPQIQ